MSQGDPLTQKDIPPHKLIARIVAVALRYSKAVVFLFSVLGAIATVLYGTVQKARAHDVVLTSHLKRIERLENLTTATYINAMLACSASGAAGCITEDRLRRGDVPTLQLATEKE